MALIGEWWGKEVETLSFAFARTDGRTTRYLIDNVLGKKAQDGAQHYFNRLNIGLKRI